MADGTAHSLNPLVAYVVPESLGTVQDLFGKYRQRFILGEPELTEVFQDEETGEWITDDTCFKFFCK